MNAPDQARDYHRLTVHDPSRLRPQDSRLLLGFQPLQWDRKPPQFKTYPGAEVTPLPADISRGSGALDVSLLSRLLFLSAGVTRVAEVGGRPLYFRAAGSAGNLSPIEVYVVTGERPGLPAGVYHYQPVQHGLVRIRTVPAGTPATLVLTGVPWRTGWKYRERGFRHLYWDAGTMLAQTLALCDEAGLAARVELGFVDDTVNRLVGADGVQEVALAVVPLEGEAVLPDDGAEVTTGHLADELVEFPLVTATQRAGQLGTAQAIEDWRRAAAALALSPATEAGSALTGALEAAVRARGSARAFDPRHTIPLELLTAAMAWATRAVSGDFTAPGTTLLEHLALLHAVDGAESGAYRWRLGRFELLRAGPMRSTARHLCLDQDLGGGGACTVFHCSHLDQVLGPLGSRGYRAAQLEAGIVEGRLHLFAYAGGLGATGLTFYDDEVSSFFATGAAPMLVTALGKPAYRTRPGGLPRQPVRLRMD